MIFFHLDYFFVVVSTCFDKVCDFHHMCSLLELTHHLTSKRPSAYQYHLAGIVGGQLSFTHASTSLYSLCTVKLSYTLPSLDRLYS